MLFDYDGSTLRLVASDRYRLAVATVLTRDQHGHAARAVVPSADLDGLQLPADADVELRLDGREVRIGAHRAVAVDAPFPDWERILRTTSPRQIAISTADLRGRVAAGPTRTITRERDSAEREVSVLLIVGDSVDVIDTPDPDAIAFDREFLLEALVAAGGEQLVLGLDDVSGPMAVQDPARADSFSMLQPVRLA